ncbi:anti-sigma factor family protein [Spirillospora sp. CA-294931]|uniref:anti-sigma factor family protein n=1 Tax=Spirillospora sp. CA-294931 TaxID=3240042 RepID=UPI003D92D771
MSLGVYVLGAIDPAERTRVDAHLEHCPACRDELAGLAGLPALLGRVDEAQLREVTGPPPEMLDSLLARAARDRPRWRSGWVPLAAAASLLLALGGVAGGLVTASARDDRPVAVRTVTPAPSAYPTGNAEKLTAASPGDRVKAEVLLGKKKWGTSVELHLSGAPYGQRCRLYAVSRDGQRDMLGSWYVAYKKGYGKYYGSTMFQRGQIFTLEIVTLDGKPLITIPA